MRLSQRLPELFLLGIALVLAAALLYPFAPASLPALDHHQNAVTVSRTIITTTDPDPQPSIREVSSLFVLPRPAKARIPPKPAAPPERVPWLHFVAYAVASSGQTAYFFKNDQTSRVLMLAFNQPHDGWNLLSIQGGTYILEKDNHSYAVTEK